MCPEILLVGTSNYQGCCHLTKRASSGPNRGLLTYPRRPPHSRIPTHVKLKFNLNYNMILFNQKFENPFPTPKKKINLKIKIKILPQNKPQNAKNHISKKKNLGDLVIYPASPSYSLNLTFIEAIIFKPTVFNFNSV